MGDVYLWGAEIKADETSGGKIDIPFHEIIQNLDMAVMGGIGAKKDKLKLYTDIIYLDLAGDDKIKTTLPNGIYVDKLDIELRAWVVSPTVAYTVYETPKYSLDLAAGARYLWIEVDLDLKTSTGKLKTSDSDHNWDAIVGIRGQMELSEKWGATVYFDGGTGDSDYTWQGLAGFNYKFAKFSGLFGYRYMKWKFDGDGPLENLQIDGPYAGAKFTF